MRAFRLVWALKDTDKLNARDFSHVPCLYGDYNVTAGPAHMESGLEHRRSLTVDDRVGNARAPHLV